MDGQIKFFNSKKGFGFIAPEDGSDVFFHISGLADGEDESKLQDDTAVSFDIEQADRGPKAVNVRVS